MSRKEIKIYHDKCGGEEKYKYHLIDPKNQSLDFDVRATFCDWVDHSDGEKYASSIKVWIENFTNDKFFCLSKVNYVKGNRIFEIHVEVIAVTSHTKKRTYSTAIKDGFNLSIKEPPLKTKVNIILYNSDNEKDNFYLIDGKKTEECLEHPYDPNACSGIKMKKDYRPSLHPKTKKGNIIVGG